MGKLAETLSQFQVNTRKYYQEISKILDEEYCWKCPMRTNRKEALCREVEVWIKLTESMEAGIREEFGENNYSMEEMEAIAAKFLVKRMKHQDIKEDNLIIKLEYDAEPFASKGDFIYVKAHPLRVKKDDLVLMPRACPLATYWYIKTSKHSTVPFKIFKVSKTYQKMGCKYIKTEEGLEVPVEYLLGVVKNIIGPDLSMQSWE
ncbi:MAG TPA: hypothetical protein VMC48_05265 [Methanobacterium sp.]|nr:hypothetical protein [Methanobacterium sp.]